ncbi:butyrophilin subfamily 3 member A2-like [Plectropomus leopardus]|uniref:butyrophilin subfamily 3 member A2-like n=1 Tax=Plectropomus leopardus TaxID=160734 RepID=UPI001C4D8776|nr:butyrophilin subfamily 3 member A2-like [Plectropomus leopardus]
MSFPMDGCPSKLRHGVICAWVVHYTVLFLFLTRCKGQSHMVGPSQPTVAKIGADIMLPCHLEPVVDVTDQTIEWTRPDLNPRFVHVLRDGVELKTKKYWSYVGRTSVSMDKLRHGDISLKLYKVKLSDTGTYRCFIPTLKIESTVELVVGAVSSLTISFLRCENGLVLQCESAGWYPEPEVSWLDGEGHVLSAGPTETVRGPDDLYIVSSRVTVDKRHSNSFTCRVQQNHINQTRETHVQVPEDFFNAPSSVGPVAIGSAVVFMLILAVIFAVWKWRRKHNSQSVKTFSSTELSSLSKDRRETLPIMAESMDIKDLDATKTSLDAKLKDVMEEFKDIEGLFNFLTDQKKNVHDQMHRIALQLHDVEMGRDGIISVVEEKGKQKEEKSVNYEKETQNEEQCSDARTNLETTKRELRRSMQDKDTFLRSIFCGVIIVRERCKLLDISKNQIKKQLEEIEEQRNEIQSKLTSET